jgi:hypothetical protein
VYIALYQIFKGEASLNQISFLETEVALGMQRTRTRILTLVGLVHFRRRRILPKSIFAEKNSWRGGEDTREICFGEIRLRRNSSSAKFVFGENGIYPLVSLLQILTRLGSVRFCSIRKKHEPIPSLVRTVLKAVTLSRHYLWAQKFVETKLETDVGPGTEILFSKQVQKP